MDCFVARSEVDNLLEIKMGGEFFGLAQCRGQIRHLDKAIADGHVPEIVRDPPHLELTCRTHPRHSLKPDREGNQTLVQSSYLDSMLDHQGRRPLRYPGQKDGGARHSRDLVFVKAL